MKTVIILLVVVVAALANSVQDRWNSVHQQCQSNRALYVDDRIFEQLKRGESPTLPANFGQHAHCMLLKLNLQDGQGRVLSDGVRQAAQRSNSANINQIVNECSANSDTKEKTALKLFGCLKKYNVNIGQL